MLIERAAESGARVACMPEHWIPEGGADLDDSLPFFSAVARENGIYVIPGADFVKRGEGRTTVESVIIDNAPLDIKSDQQKLRDYVRQQMAGLSGMFDGIRVDVRRLRLLR